REGGGLGMSGAPPSSRPEAPAPSPGRRSLDRRQAWRRRRRDAGERVIALWTRLRTLDTVVASIAAIVLGVGLGVVLYEAWLQSLTVAVIFGLAIAGWL